MATPRVGSSGSESEMATQPWSGRRPVTPAPARDTTAGITARRSTMRAVQIRHFGGYEELEVTDRPTPVAGPGQAVIRVRAAGVNLADTLIRQNRYALTPNLPLVIGNEVAGVVHALGPGVEGIRIGTRVAAPLFFPQGVSGGYADYATVDAGLVVPIPDALPFDHATALMVQGTRHHRQAGVGAVA